MYRKLGPTPMYDERARPWLIKSQSTSPTSFHSLKNGRPIFCESTLEADYCIWLERNHDVHEYFSNPEVFSMWVDEKIVKYTPDFRVHFRDGSRSYIEIKVSFLRIREQTQAKLEAFGSVCQRYGWEFKCISEKEIRCSTCKTLKDIYSYIQNMDDFSAEHLEAFREFRSWPTTLETLLQSTDNFSLSTICAGLFGGYLIADLREPFEIDFRIKGVSPQSGSGSE